MIDPDAGPPPDVSIVIRTFNESETLPRCIEGLRTQATPRRVELIVVDSGSTDGTPALARRLGAHVYAVPQAAFNYGGALNLGARRARAPVVVCFTAHAAPVDDVWLERLLAPLDSDPRTAGSFSRELPWRDADPLEAARLELRYPDDPARALDIVGFSNVASAARRDVLLEIPFPELAYGEDRVWAKAVQERGWSIVYVPEARVFHSHRESLGAFYRRQVKVGRSKRELAAGRVPLGPIVKSALGDWRVHARVLLGRRGVGPLRKAWWLVVALAMTAAKLAGQTRGAFGNR